MCRYIPSVLSGIHCLSYVVMFFPFVVPGRWLLGDEVAPFSSKILLLMFWSFNGTLFISPEPILLDNGEVCACGPWMDSVSKTYQIRWSKSQYNYTIMWMALKIICQAKYWIVLFRSVSYSSTAVTSYSSLLYVSKWCYIPY